MSDIKDYLFGELEPAKRREVEQTLRTDGAARDEWERLQSVQAALCTLREEEMPRRIAFVSDKVFEPRWYHGWWNSASKLAFAGAAMLSAAILVHAFRPMPAVAPSMDAALMEQHISQEVATRLPAAVQQAVGELAARQKVEMARAVSRVEEKFATQRRMDVLTLDAEYRVMRQQQNNFYMASQRGNQ